MRKIFILTLILVLLLALLIAGCGGSEVRDDDASEDRAVERARGSGSNIPTNERTMPERDDNAGSPTGAAVTDTNNGVGLGDVECSVSADCTEGEDCIDNSCGTIAQLYQTDCESKCNYNLVTISTSDGESYTFQQGKGSYTAAGALEWKLAVVPDYCQGEEAVSVPIRFIKKTTGKILGQEVITLNEGETSRAITHPTVASVAFTMTLENVDESCD